MSETEIRYSLDDLIDRTPPDIPDPPQSIGVGKDGEPRLMIEKIVNFDFKSYAGEKIIGPFHKVSLRYWQQHGLNRIILFRHLPRLLDQMVPVNQM